MSEYFTFIYEFSAYSYSIHKIIFNSIFTIVCYTNMLLRVHAKNDKNTKAPHYWPFVRGVQWRVDSSPKGLVKEQRVFLPLHHHRKLARQCLTFVKVPCPTLFHAKIHFFDLNHQIKCPVYQIINIYWYLCKFSWSMSWYFIDAILPVDRRIMTGTIQLCWVS